MALSDSEGGAQTTGTAHRRDLLKGAGTAVSVLLGVAALAVPRSSGAKPLVPSEDKRVVARNVTFPGASGPLQAYYARPAAARGKAPAVLLIHESRGRTEYVEDVARRLAVAGFIALAPDYLSPRGGTPAEAEKARQAASALESDQVTADAVASLVWLKSREEGNGKVAAVGFAWGGGIALRLAVVAPALDAAAIYYGKLPKPEDAAQIKAPLLLHYAQLDQKAAGEAVPAFEAALRQARVPFESHTYEGVGASFHNDTADKKFNAQAAQQAWERTLAFLKQRLT